MTKVGQKFVLKIRGDDAESMKSQIIALAKLAGVLTAPEEALPNVEVSLPARLDGIGLDELKAYVCERLNHEGFEVTITAREEPKPPGKKGRKKIVDAETAARKLKGNGEDAPEPNFEAQGSDDGDDEVDPAAARDWVIGALSKRFENPTERSKVTDFSNRMSKKYGKSGEKLSLLPTEAFPAILVAMQKEFGA
jgi:hypothetical protein